jgi:coenzyme F420-0:L-glutamate ligase/coenzyme F420-1:gamma-L-glutamate ligase
MQVVAVPGLPRIDSSSNLAQLIFDASILWPDHTSGLTDGDIVVITSKVVSKAEGNVVASDNRDELIDSQSVRTLATKHHARGTTRIVQTHHGLVLAAAGIDASNVEAGTVVLLPQDPDASAQRIRKELQTLTGKQLAVVITDTMGRAWRNGLTDNAIGIAGLLALDDHTGKQDQFGRTLEMTVIAIADEIASAADLVKGKSLGNPVAIVRGMSQYVTTDDGLGAAPLIRAQEEDLFWLGTAEAIQEGHRTAAANRRTVRNFTEDYVSDEIIHEAISAATTAPAPHHSTPWRFLILRDQPVRSSLLDAMRDKWLEDLRSHSDMTDEQISKRLARGDILRTAPLVVIPFIDLEAGAHTYPDDARNAAERDMFMVAGGAAVENMLVSLAAQGVGSAWIGSTLFSADTVRAVLQLPNSMQPLGAIAIGYAASSSKDRDTRDPQKFIIN